MKFNVHPEIFKFFPSLKLAVVALDVEADVGRARVEALWRRAWEEAAREASVDGNAQSHPRISPWREGMGAMGVSGRKYPSSVEALLRRVLKGGEPASINPLVDFYNAVSLRHVVPAGGFDVNEIDGTLELRLTRGGDTFHPLDGSAAENVGEGEGQEDENIAKTGRPSARKPWLGSLWAPSGRRARRCARAPTTSA